MHALAQSTGWRAHLALTFAARGTRTVLTHRAHHGPLVVQRPFYPEGDTCHVYLLHPPGGVVGGDALAIEAHLGPGAHTLITTPGAGKFYRTAGPLATLTQTLRVAAGATLEWLPQENIFFDGCAVSMATHVHLHADARFAGWEISCLGRPASGEVFQHGRCHQRLELWRDEQPILLERARFEGGSPLLHARFGLAGQAVTGTFAVTPADGALLAAVRTIEIGPDELFSATLLDDVLVCRYLGRHTAAARQRFSQAWGALRPLWIGRAACAPRVWNT